MGKPITKLNKLKNPESFVQINLVKGYKYIDRAGAIVNRYYDEMAPEFSMGLNGLVLKQPLDNVEEFKVAPEMIWAKFVNPGSLDLIVNHFSKEAEAVSEIIEVSKVTRVGWRNYFIHEFSQPEEGSKYFANLSRLSNPEANLKELLYTFATDKDLEVKVAIRSAVKADDTNTEAVLFDVDVFRKSEIPLENLSSVCKSIADYLRSEFLEFVNSTFEESSA